MKEQNSRRSCLRQTGAVAFALTVGPRHVLGGQGHTAPSDQLTTGVIGVGGMGRGHFGSEGTRLRAICDVASAHLEKALGM